MPAKNKLPIVESSFIYKYVFVVSIALGIGACILSRYNVVGVGVCVKAK